MYNQLKASNNDTVYVTCVKVCNNVINYCNSFVILQIEPVACYAVDDLKLKHVKRPVACCTMTLNVEVLFTCYNC